MRLLPSLTLLTAALLSAEALSLGGSGTGEPDRTIPVDPAGDKPCICVPFTQCKDGDLELDFEPATDGSGLLDVRFGPSSKCKSWNQCCPVPEDKLTRVESLPGVQKGVMNTITDGIRDIFGGGDSGSGGSGGSGSGQSSLAGQCACVPFYNCDAGTLSPEMANQIDLRQVSSTGRCTHSNEKCCAFPAAPVKPPPVPQCSCVTRPYCAEADIQPLRPGLDVVQPNCALDQVCCKSPRDVPTGGSGTSPVPAGGSGTYPAVERPDYDVWKFCKSYPYSVACAHSRRTNSQPTLVESARFNPDKDANELKAAFTTIFGKVIDADDDVLIRILTKRTFSQRALITQAYSKLYGKDLYDSVTSGTRGKFENLMQALLKKPNVYEYLAQEMHDAMDRIGTDEDTVLETLISSTSEEIETLKRLFYQIEQKQLVDDIKSDFSGDLEDILVKLAEGNRDSSFKVSKTRAREQARALYEAAEAGWGGTDEESFKYYLTNENYPQLALIFSEFEQIAGRTITEALESEFSSYMEDAVVAIVEVTRSLPHYFALRIHDALWHHGLIGVFGKDDSSLIRLVVSRAEIDLGSIVREYEAKYGRKLVDDIKLKSTGDYQDALVALCGGDSHH